MRHPTEGALRRLLDEPDAVAHTDHTHVESCAACRGELDAIRADADLVTAALATDAGDQVDVDVSWRRLHSTPPSSVVTASRPRRHRQLLRRPVAAAFAAGLVVTGAGVAAANDWLPIFRTESIEPVAFGTADLIGVPALDAYGDLDVTDTPDRRAVDSAAAAEAATGLEVPEVTHLPRGVAGEPDYEVLDQISATFTFSVARAADAAAEAGEDLPPPPPGLDGSSVRLVAGPGLAALWSTARGTPGLLVARAVAPTAFSDGVAFEVVRDYLLSLPGLSDEVAAQLQTFAADGETLPLPVPADRFETSTTEVRGVEATALEARGGLLAAVVWVDDGIVTVVAGPLSTDEVVAVAEGLR